MSGFEPESAQSAASDAGSDEPGLGLLSTPVSAMRRELAREKEAARRAKFDALERRVDAVLQGDTRSDARTNDGDDGRLWVDRYSPTSFADLLSDERVNRRALLWLKQWDPVVFGTSPPVVVDRRRGGGGRGGGPLTSGGSATGGLAGTGVSSPSTKPSGKLGTRSPSSSRFAAQSQVDKRPFHKVMLLCGPPGLGKTTLAHVIARHCGYRPVEVNASDERTARRMKLTIEDVTTMQGAGLPSCLILDEIDGVMQGGGDGGSGSASSAASGGGSTSGAINELLRAIQRPLKSADGGTGGARQRSGGGNNSSSGASSTGGRPVRRPIICICNDKYAPALRALRQVALVLDLAPPRLPRIVQRLQEICSREQVPVDSTALSALAESAGRDVRSCLNTLQMAACQHRAGSGPPARLDARALLGGSHKDVNASIFDVWRAVFTHTTATSSSSSGRGAAGSRVASGLLTHWELFSAHADSPILFPGVFENFLGLVHRDALLHQTRRALDWLGFADSLSGAMSRPGSGALQFGLRRYLAAPLVGIRDCFAHHETAPRALQFPRQERRVADLRLQCTHVIQSLLCSAPAAATAHARATAARPRLLSMYRPLAIVLDVVSPALDIFAPQIRVANSQLQTETERAEFRALVDSHVDWGLRYPRGSARGDSDLDTAMDPPLPRLVEGLGGETRHARLTPVQAQMLDVEIRRELARRAASRRQEAARATGGEDGPRTPRRGGRTGGGGSPVTPTTPGSARKRSRQSLLPTSPLPASGRRRRSPAATQQQTTGAPAAVPSLFWESSQQEGEAVAAEDGTAETSRPPPSALMFKFQEGFTAAVKRSVYVQDF